MSAMPTPETLRAIRRIYERRTLRDLGEKTWRLARERLCGVDRSIFDKTRAYYRDAKGQEISRQEALARALDKARHKSAWFARERRSVEEIMAFYREVEVYPFRQPLNKRFGGFRWYVRLVGHIDRPSILEYGCGSAVLTEWLIERFPRCRYTVADIPSTTLEFVKWKQARYASPYRVLTIGAGKAGIPLDEPYDLIICQDVLEHTPNPLEIAASFIDHLSVGGVLIVDFLNAPGGENLQAAVEQRQAVKRLLSEALIPLKAIDVPSRSDGLYVKGPGAVREPGALAAAAGS